MTHLVPCPESSPTPSMTIFQNKSLLFYKSKSIGQTPIFTCFYQVSCVFLWVANFRGLTAGFSRLLTLLRTFIAGYICLTKNTGFFTREDIYPFFLYLIHVFFISFFFYATMRLNLDIVPFYQATIEHQTQC